jgi:hypothetical protein
MKRWCSERSSKRGQLTIFVIIAVVVVIAIIGYYLIEVGVGFGEIAGSEGVYGSVVDCLDYMGQSAVYVVSYQGGYNTAPEKNFDFSPTFFSYHYYEGEAMVPSIEMIEKEMGAFVDDNLGACLDDIDSGGFEISYDVSDIDVEITKPGVNFVVDMPIVLTKGDDKMIVELSELPVFVETKLYDIIEISRYFVDDLKEDPDYYCISCITSMAEEAGVKFYLFPVVDDVILVMAFEDEINPVSFNFVNKFNPSSEEQ